MHSLVPRSWRRWRILAAPVAGLGVLAATARANLGANGRRYLGQIVATDATSGASVRTQVGCTARTSGTPCTCR
jgi:hypothetical protein